MSKEREEQFGDPNYRTVDDIIFNAANKSHRSQFNEWFQDLLMSQGACLLRDVLRDSKEEMFKHWLKRLPIANKQEIPNE